MRVCVMPVRKYRHSRRARRTREGGLRKGGERTRDERALQAAAEKQEVLTGIPFLHRSCADNLAENRHDGFRSACIRRLLDLGLEAEEAGAP